MGCLPRAHGALLKLSPTPHNRPSDVLHTVQCLSSYGTTRADLHRATKTRADLHRATKTRADLHRATKIMLVKKNNDPTNKGSTGGARQEGSLPCRKVMCGVRHQSFPHQPGGTVPKQGSKMRMGCMNHTGYSCTSDSTCSELGGTVV